jgi:mono/diheme cytochrome c family protein
MQSRWTAAVAVVLIATISVTWVVAQSGRTVADGVYTNAQAQRGQAIYAQECRACHGPKAEGGLGPPLTGGDFLRIWNGRSLADLVDKVEHTMPASKPGTLTRAQAADVVAYVLQVSAFKVGPQELQTNDTLNRIAIVAPPGLPPLAIAAASGASPGPVNPARPQGNMAQVMRGILFPSSNLLFNVQTADPGAVKVGYQPDVTASFSWVDWGAGIYSGWELVDYASIALAESAPLLLMPGRRCENGKPVPVGNADWIRFTEELVVAGQAAYKASQSRNRDAVIEVTNQIADACLRCHEVYRDKPGGTTEDPSNKAARCVP